MRRCTKSSNIKKSTNLITPLKIYTAPECSGCEYVNKNTGDCKYVPNIFNFND